jgi:hypothetical protein
MPTLRTVLAGCVPLCASEQEHYEAVRRPDGRVARLPLSNDIESMWLYGGARNPSVAFG